ncbi:MAG: dTDP-4-dehydrorhamnose 3,5-epimerase [Chloroflexota bacterium]
MEIREAALNGLLLLETKAFSDERGYFMETFKASEFERLDLPTSFPQDNFSRSKRGTLRGMHFQWSKPMGKLLRVTRGAAQFFEVDIRKNSPTLGKSFSAELTSGNRLALWVPPGFANGFMALEDDTIVQYKCTAEWNAAGEGSINPFDAELSLDWRLGSPTLSDKDAAAQSLRQWLARPESDAFSL